MVLMVRFLVLSWCMQSNVLETHCNKIRYTWNLIFLPHSHVLTPNVFPPLSNPSTLPTLEGFLRVFPDPLYLADFVNCFPVPSDPNPIPISYPV